MVSVLMPPKKTESKEVTRKTAAIQIEKDLARMAAVIASHRRMSQADLVSPVLRQFLTAQYAVVSAEIQKEVKERRASM